MSGVGCELVGHLRAALPRDVRGGQPQHRRGAPQEVGVEWKEHAQRPALPHLAFRVWGLRAYRLGFRVQDSGFRVHGSGLRVEG